MFRREVEVGFCRSRIPALERCGALGIEIASGGRRADRDRADQTTLAGLDGREATPHCRCADRPRRIPRAPTRITGRHNARPHTTDADRTARSNLDGGAGSRSVSPEDVLVAARTVTLPIVAEANAESAMGVRVTIGGEANVKTSELSLIGDEMLRGAIRGAL